MGWGAGKETEKERTNVDNSVMIEGWQGLGGGGWVEVEEGWGVNGDGKNLKNSK